MINVPSDWEYLVISLIVIPLEKHNCWCILLPYTAPRTSNGLVLRNLRAEIDRCRSAGSDLIHTGTVRIMRLCRRSRAGARRIPPVRSIGLGLLTADDSYRSGSALRSQSELNRRGRCHGMTTFRSVWFPIDGSAPQNQMLESDWSEDDRFL